MKPDFFKSDYFVPEIDNWHLKKDAPEEIKREFEEWMKDHNKPNVIVD